MGNGRGRSENKAIQVWELWEVWMAEHSLLAPPPHPTRGQHSHAWHVAGVKKEELCEQLPLKEVVSLGVIQGQGVSGSEEGRGLKRGRQDLRQGRALMTLGPWA